MIAPKIGKYKRDEEYAKTEQYHISDIEEAEQRQIENEKYEKKGLRYALIVLIAVMIFFIYALIPGLPHSGVLLDLDATTYVDQLFGKNLFFVHLLHFH